MKVNVSQTRKKRKRWRLLILSFAAMLTVGAGGLLFLLPYSHARMDMSLMDIPSVHEPSVLYAYDPSTRASRTGALHPAPNSVLADIHPRVYTAYEDMPLDLISAFIAIEDQRFWEHDGVDLLRTARAGIQYLMGKSAFGGSTITQQLIKNLTGDDRHTPDRKLTEIFMALDLERRTDKTAILEAYLNVINLSEGCYGVGAAAKRYYSKSVSELTLPECASIAAITNNPTRYNPLTHPENHLARRNLILRVMAEQGYITPSVRDEAMASELELHPTAPPESPPPASWYADLVVADVIRDLQRELGYTHAAASMLVYRGGLTIETAMDERMQKAVETYYAHPSHFPTGDNGCPQSAFILMDPTTGDVLAVAGAIGEKTANRLQNYATDTRRPAGSCIKPLTVYAPALDRGLLTWASIWDDAPLTEKNGTPWPANADGVYHGRVSVGQAVAQSLNPVAVRILERVGLENAFSFARDQLGMTSLIPPSGKAENDMTVSSLALGQQSRGVTVRELTAAYTVFTEGIYRPPVSYHRVLDRAGNVLLENKPVGDGKRVLSPENAAIMTKLLTTVTSEGTASRYITLSRYQGVETAGKTGTTQNNCDRWFIGYTPRLLAGVWMGYDYPLEMKGIQGNPCVSIWDDLLKICEPLYNGTPPKTKFDLPDTVTEQEFCPLSGMLPNPYCTDPVQGQASERGWFVRGTQPNQACIDHTEPPIRILPHDPNDPERIPLLPEDLLPSDHIAPPIAHSEEPWYTRYSRWFDRLLRERRRA